MPRYVRPRDLDFGNTGHGAEVITPYYRNDTRPEVGLERTFFSKNRRYVYETRVRYWNSDGRSQTLVRRRYEIPICWDESQVRNAPDDWDPEEVDTFGDTFRTARLGDGIVHLVEGQHEPEVLVFPLGWDSRWGLARLDLSATPPHPTDGWEHAEGSISETDATWTIHPARSGGLRVDSARNAWSLGFAASDDFVFAAVHARGVDQGVAVYLRDRSDYRFLGIIPMPRLADDSDESSMHPRGLVVHEGSRTLLWVSIRHTSPTLDTNSPQPSAFAFDISDRDATGVRVFLDAGNSLLTSVVVRRLPSPNPNLQHFTGIDVGVMPSGDGKVVLAVSSVSGLEVYDVTDVSNGTASLSPLSQIETFGSMDGSSFVPEVSPVGQDLLMGTYGVSNGPCAAHDIWQTSCGPPDVGWPVSVDYDNLFLSPSIQQGGLAVAGNYILWSWWTFPTDVGQGSGVTLLAWMPPFGLYESTAELARLELRRIGFLQGVLDGGMQQETLWPMRFDRGSNRVFAAARSQYGMLSWDLPNQHEASSLAEDPPNDQWYPPPRTFCSDSCGPGVALTVDYPASQARQTTKYPDPPASNQLPANLSADHIEEAFPNLAGYGYGGEWENGTVFQLLDAGGGLAGEVLLFADRGNNAVWAHSADPLRGTFLDAFQVIANGQPVPGLRDVAAVQDGIVATVGAVSASNKSVYFMEWSWSSKTLNSPLGPDNLNLTVDTRWLIHDSNGVLVPGNIGHGLEGIFAITEIDLESTAPAEPPRFGCALRWWQDQDLADNQGAWRDGWDLALVPASGDVAEGVLYWRIPRTEEGVDVAAVSGLIPDTPSGGVNRILGPDSSLQPRDLVQHGEHMYIVALAVRHDGEPLLPDESQFWMLTLRMVPGGGSAPDPVESAVGNTAVGLASHGVDAQQFVDAHGVVVDANGDPAAAPVDLYLVQALPLLSPAPAPGDERRRINISPDGRWLTIASGGTRAGFFLIDVGDPDDPNPVVVSGLRKQDQGEWYGWNQVSRTLGDPDEDGVLEVTEPLARVGHYPAWPLPWEDGQPEVLPVFQSAPFAQTPTGDLFIVIDGSPITLWKIDPLMREDLTSHDDAIWSASDDPEENNPLQYVGALCGWYQERKRLALVGSEAVFLLGDLGVVALPNALAAPVDGCCVIEPAGLATQHPGTGR